MADLFLVSTSDDPADAKEAFLMHWLMSRHCSRFRRAGSSHLSAYEDMSGHLAFFISEFLTHVNQDQLEAIAEKLFNVSEEEYKARQKRWAAHCRDKDIQQREQTNEEEQREELLHGRRSLWPQAAWVLERIALEETTAGDPSPPSAELAQAMETALPRG